MYIYIYIYIYIYTHTEKDRSSCQKPQLRASPFRPEAPGTPAIAPPFAPAPGIRRGSHHRPWWFHRVSLGKLTKRPGKAMEKPLVLVEFSRNSEFS